MIWKKWRLNTLLDFCYIIYQWICSLFYVHQINHRKCALYQHLLKKKNPTTSLTVESFSSNISQILGNSYACPKLLCSFSQQIIPPDANYLALCFTDGKQIYNKIFTFPETKGKLLNFTSIWKSAMYIRDASLSYTDSFKLYSYPESLD